MSTIWTGFQIATLTDRLKEAVRNGKTISLSLKESTAKTRAVIDLDKVKKEIKVEQSLGNTMER